jgi:hypothetical protein
MEIVQGKREELYWDKVPEKVRKQAVQKVVNTQVQMNGDERLHVGETGLDVRGEEDGASSTKRRKRKRDK